MASPRPYYNQGHLPNGANNSTNMTSAGGQGSNFLPNNGRIVQSGGTRILCVADVRGNLKSLNDLAQQARANYIIHTGDFGFYDEDSLQRIADKTLKHVAQYSPLLSENTKRVIQASQPQNFDVKQRFSPHELQLSELSMFIDKKLKLDIPVYTVWGACEDVRVLEKFRSGEYKVDNLHIIDEANSRLLEVGGVKLRLLGLGGAVVMHKLFDNGEGRTTIAGGQGTMWTTLLQMGELVDTANRVYDPTETRVFVTHASPAREGLLNQLSVTLKADFSVSAGLHFRYGSSYNEFSVNPTLDHYRGKLAASKASFNDVWETVKSEVEPAVSQNDAQKQLLDNALDIVTKMPTVANGGNPFSQALPGQGTGGQVDESAFKNMWNFNLADAAFGYLVLEIEAGRIGTEMRAQGFNFAHRGSGGPKQGATQPIQSPAQGGPTNAVMQGMGPTNNRAPVAPSSQSSQQFSQAQQPGQQPRSQQPPAQPKQAPLQNRGPTSQARPSPAPAAPAQTQAKPATPQPTTTTTNAAPSTAPSSEKQAPSTQTSAQASEKVNGATPGWNSTSADLPSTSTPSTKPANKPASPAVEKKPSTGLFIHNMESEQAVRDIFPDEDKSKIVKIENYGKTNHVVHFANHEDALTALNRQPSEFKQKNAPQAQPGQPRKPNIKWYDDRGPKPKFRENQGGQGAGTWQGSNRSASGSGPTRPGYQSDRNASDSEGGRGRGGFQGRGRGRGNERGGRGSRGGRGGGNNKSGGDENSSPAAPAAQDPKPAATPNPATAAPSGGAS
ncbi:MAG: hypothetical protein ASARMPREDX12_001139 [Alectoria sarmentosa]|nr:MAG: hypothetical protein ASARMPREDX12_001139 [Alectoria sarmentosa]